MPTKRLLAVILIALQFGPVGFCEEVKADSRMNITLGGAITIAYKNNKDIQIQEQQLEVAQAQILGARSNFLPKLNVNGGYTYAGAGLDKRLRGFQNINELGASVDQIVYNGGANTANLRTTQLGLKVQEETLRAKKLDVEFEAKRLYYGLLFAYEVVRITQNLFDQAQAHYEDVKNKFQQGTASRFDLLQSKVQVSKVMPELVRAENAVSIIMAELNKLLGFKVDVSLALQDALTYSLIQIREGEFLKEAYLNKPEMILKSLGIDISKWAIALAKSTYRPQINADVNYGYITNNPGNMVKNTNKNWSAGFSVTIPIFDGFFSKAKVDEAKAKYTEANLDKANLADQIAVDIRRGCLDMTKAGSIIDYSKDNIEEAREAVRISEFSYDNGVGTNLDVLDTQVSLSQVEKNLSEAIYDYLMAKAFLDRTMGREYLKEAQYAKKE